MSILGDLSFQEFDFSKKNRFRYESHFGPIDFVKMNGSIKFDDVFFDIHRDIWNENKIEIFVLILDDKHIHVCDAKTFPIENKPLENVTINSFDYGTNSKVAKKYMELLKKENIDNGFFWEDVSKYIKEREVDKKRSPVDLTLLENLTILREKITCHFDQNSDENAQRLIDRCLYIRFIEDRLGFNDLKIILKEKRIEDLLALFKYYNGSLNGDLFDNEFININSPSVLKELDRVFGEYYVYPNGQKTLSPYKFDKIPILLISNIYQEFLSSDQKNSGGIVYTPENVVNFTINSVFESEIIVERARLGDIKILDSACGSGIFLVKSFERLLIERKKSLMRSLDLYEKSKLLQKCIFGIDIDKKALRVAAFSLYLKLFDDIDPEIIQEQVFNRYDKGLEHFMFPGLEDNNLINANSLFDRVLCSKFDIILGNPPWGYKFKSAEKNKIDEIWGKNVSQYQSSQCFLHVTENWMKEDTIAGLIVNISNFTNTRSKQFRDELLKHYSILKFVTLTKIKEITFEEPACVLIFSKKKTKSQTEFLIPELSPFSKLTKMITIRDDSRFKLDQNKLNDDKYWHISLLGLHRYIELINKIDMSKSRLGDISIVKEAARFYSSENGDIDEAKRKYESDKKIDESYYPFIRSTTNIQPFFVKQDKLPYIKYNKDLLHRAKDIKLFEGDKLVLSRSWPLKAALVQDTIIFNSSFDILRLKDETPDYYLYIIEAILNSKLGYFYLEALYKQRPEGNFSKVNKSSIREFPIPCIDKNDEYIGKIKEITTKIRETNNVDGSLEEMDDLVFSLYDIDYYEKMQIIDYYKLKKRQKKNLVRNEDLAEYIEEFKESIECFIKEGRTLNAECYISEFLGTLITFTFSEVKKEPKFNQTKTLKRLNNIIQKDRVGCADQKSIYEEKKLKFYDTNSLTIYKSNNVRDWTRTEAMNDVREEISTIYQNLGS